MVTSMPRQLNEFLQIVPRKTEVQTELANFTGHLLNIAQTEQNPRFVFPLSAALGLFGNFLTAAQQLPGFDQSDLTYSFAATEGGYGDPRRKMTISRPRFFATGGMVDPRQIATHNMHGVDEMVDSGGTITLLNEAAINSGMITSPKQLHLQATTEKQGRIGNPAFPNQYPTPVIFPDIWLLSSYMLNGGLGDDPKREALERLAEPTLAFRNPSLSPAEMAGMLQDHGKQYEHYLRRHQIEDGQLGANLLYQSFLRLAGAKSAEEKIAVGIRHHHAMLNRAQK